METYQFGALVWSGIAGLVFGAVLVYFIMRDRVEIITHYPATDSQTGNCNPLPDNFSQRTPKERVYGEGSSADPDAPEFFPPITDEDRENYERALREDEEQRIENEREKATLHNHITNLLRAGYVMVDGIPRRYSFCLEEGEKTPFGNMYYRNEEPEECLSIEIRDQRRITQPPEWYDLISGCYKLVDGVKSLRYALMLSMGVEQDTIERPLRLVFHDNGYMPVIKVYTDMSWFDDQRWGGPVIIVGHNGQAMGIVPAMKPYEVHLLMEEVVAKALPFMDAMPSDYDGHMQLSQGIAELHAAIKEAGCHAKEVEEA